MMIGLDNRVGAVMRLKFFDFIPIPIPFTHIHGWQGVCVRGPGTGTKLPKIYITLILLDLLAR